MRLESPGFYNQAMMRVLKSCILLAGFIASAQQPKIVEITSEPSHRLVMENDWVRVFDVVVVPKATTLVHRHDHDYVFVALGDSDITSERPGEKPVRTTLMDGEVRFTKGGFAHDVSNNGSRSFHSTAIEILGPSTGVHPCTESCSVDTPCLSPEPQLCPIVQTMVQSDQWKITSVILPASATIAEHTHTGPHMVMAVTDLDLSQMLARDKSSSYSRNGLKPIPMHRAVGDVDWIDPITHSITNSGVQTARFVVMEFKAPPAKDPHSGE